MNVTGSVGMSFNDKIERLRNRFVDMLRGLPHGHELTTAEVCEHLYLPDDNLVHKVLAPVKEAGVVRVREHRGEHLWSLA